MPIVVPQPTAGPAPGVPAAAAPLNARDTPNGLAGVVWALLPMFMREADDGTLWNLVRAVCSPAAPIVDWLVSDEPLDPATIPSDRLAWLATLAGVDTTGIPDDALRNWLLDWGTRRRGDLTGIRNRVGLTLTGSRSVRVVWPHNGDPMRMLVRTYDAETPDRRATEAAIRAEVPAWMQLDQDIQAPGIDYDTLGQRYATYDDLARTGKTYQQLSEET